MKRTVAILLGMLVALPAVVGCEEGIAGEPKQLQVAERKTQYPGALYRKFERIEPPTEFPAHPRLFLNQEEIDELKAWIARDAELREYVEKFVAEMLEAAEEPELPTADKRDNGGIARQANKFALAYVLSGEPKLAEAAAEILRTYIGLFPDYDIAGLKGKATDSTLGEVQWAAHACGAYDLIYNAGVLTDAEKTALEQDVFKVSAEVMLACNHAYRSNWRIAATGGVGVVGFCIGDRDLLDKALHGQRDETGLLFRDGFVNQMAWSQLADGIYYERSSSYSSICMMFYTWMLEAARHSGLDLWHMEFEGTDYDLGVDYDRQFERTGSKVFTSYFDALCHRCFGDTSLANVGNDGSGGLERKFYWAAAWRAKRDDKYAWLFRKGLEDDAIVGDPLELMYLSPEMPSGEFDLSADTRVGLTGEHTNTCTLLPNGGFAVLRQDAAEDAAGVAITYGEYINAHSHPDQLSICLYAGGHVIAPDMKDYGYGHEGHLEWAKQTIAHNTVTVDEVSQYPQGEIADVWVGDTVEKRAFGRLTFFHPGERLKAVRAETDLVYEGVTLDRTVVLVDSVVVDFYRCRSEVKHQYDYALHVDAELSGTDAAFGDVEEGPPSERFGYKHLIDVRRASTAGKQVKLTYQPTEEQGGRTMHVALMSDGQAEIVTAKGYPNKAGHRRSALIVRRGGTNVDFVSAMSFEGVGDVESVEQMTGLPDGLLGVRIVRTGGQTDIIVSAETSGRYTVVTDSLTHADGRGTLVTQTFTGQLALIRNVDGKPVVVDVVK